MITLMEETYDNVHGGVHNMITFNGGDLYDDVNGGYM